MKRLSVFCGGFLHPLGATLGRIGEPTDPCRATIEERLITRLGLLWDAGTSPTKTASNKSQQVMNATVG